MNTPNFNAQNFIGLKKSISPKPTDKKNTKDDITCSNSTDQPLIQKNSNPWNKWLAFFGSGSASLALLSFQIPKLNFSAWDASSSLLCGVGLTSFVLRCEMYYTGMCRGLNMLRTITKTKIQENYLKECILYDSISKEFRRLCTSVLKEKNSDHVFTWNDAQQLDTQLDAYWSSLWSSLWSCSDDTITHHMIMNTLKRKWKMYLCSYFAHAKTVTPDMITHETFEYLIHQVNLSENKPHESIQQLYEPNCAEEQKLMQKYVDKHSESIDKRYNYLKKFFYAIVFLIFLDVLAIFLVSFGPFCAAFAPLIGGLWAVCGGYAVGILSALCLGLLDFATCIFFIYSGNVNGYQDKFNRITQHCCVPAKIFFSVLLGLFVLGIAGINILFGFGWQDVGFNALNALQWTQEACTVISQICIWVYSSLSVFFSCIYMFLGCSSLLILRFSMIGKICCKVGYEVFIAPFVQCARIIGQYTWKNIKRLPIHVLGSILSVAHIPLRIACVSLWIAAKFAAIGCVAYASGWAATRNIPWFDNTEAVGWIKAMQKLFTTLPFTFNTDSGSMKSMTNFAGQCILFLIALPKLIVDLICSCALWCTEQVSFSSAFGHAQFLTAQAALTKKSSVGKWFQGFMGKKMNSVLNQKANLCAA